jgi:prepilin-type N-terminal cleavage/methylation domain-containing protein
MRSIPRKFGALRRPLAIHRLTKRRQCAFTFVELVVVTLLMSILAAAAIPVFLDSLLHHRVESAARRLKADLELARNTARLTSATRSLTFTGASYTISNFQSLDNPNAPYTVDLADAPFELSTVTPDFSGAATVTFDGYGKPSSGGTVVLGCKDQACTVTLNGTTGVVTITSVESDNEAGELAGN